MSWFIHCGVTCWRPKWNTVFFIYLSFFLCSLKNYVNCKQKPLQEDFVELLHHLFSPLFAACQLRADPIGEWYHIGLISANKQNKNKYRTFLSHTIFLCLSKINWHSSSKTLHYKISNERMYRTQRADMGLISVETQSSVQKWNDSFSTAVEDENSDPAQCGENLFWVLRRR